MQILASNKAGKSFDKKKLDKQEEKCDMMKMAPSLPSVWQLLSFVGREGKMLS